MRTAVVNNIVAACVIYRAANPLWIFSEQKDDTYPYPALRGHLNAFGGHHEPSDESPHAVLLRELGEEFVDSTTLREPDRAPFRALHQYIMAHLMPLQDYLCLPPPDRAPRQSADSWVELVSYFAVGLPEPEWHCLEGLQGTYGNLSLESATVLTNTSEARTPASHDLTRALVDLYRGLGIAVPPPVDDAETHTHNIGIPRATYAAYPETVTFEDVTVYLRP